jgi:hypothetical protein
VDDESEQLTRARALETVSRQFPGMKFGEKMQFIK